HDHWDHTGGLWELLNAKKGLKVYGCPNFSKELKNRGREFKSAFIEADKVTKVREKIYTTGEISGEYKKEYMPEQALVIETDKGISVITGCAHPGIIKILEQVKKNFNNKNFYMVFGGFHLMNKDKRVINLIADEFKKLGVQKAGPSHCSGLEAEEIFRNKYKDDFVEIKVGQTIEV
ncbi:MAG: MBL fold metallo-hydrolase, partial [Candidatus Omnitrophica bacterium]|nr:MBL fold metallo-hydrolase [Candidatus Omnitrophota bacterium]